MKVYGNLVTACHDCPFNNDFYICNLGCKEFEEGISENIVPNSCPMLQEETHSVTIMLSDQYNKSNG